MPAPEKRRSGALQTGFETTLRLLLLAGLVAMGAACGSSSNGNSEELACAGDATAFSRQIEQYAADRLSARVEGRAGQIDALKVQVPKLDVSADGVAKRLPLGPCQHIYRFDYRSLGNSGAPFEYVEVDWNTEGKPRGPNNSFVTPHFDFHFYLLPRAQVDQAMQCESSNGRTCDPFLTSYDRTRRFLEMPAPERLPSSYKPDVDSSIPEMGLHHLDFANEYTVSYVDHHPTLLYGSFGGQIAFLESSVTPVTLRDAINSSSHTVKFPLAQPPTCPAERWPSDFTVRYLPRSEGFEVAFAGFKSCSPE